MQRYITHILLCLLIVLSACHRDDVEITPTAKGRLVLDLLTIDSQTRADASTEHVHEYFESLVEHIDVFIFEHDNEGNGNKVHYERLEINSDIAQNTVALHGIGLGDLLGKTIDIYTVANSAKSTDVLSAITTASSLKEQIEEQPLIYLAGTGLSGGNMTAPNSFLMWGEQTDIEIAANAIGDKNIAIELERAVAKIEFHFLRYTGDKVDQEGNPILPSIHGFGFPEIEISDVENIPLTELEGEGKYTGNGNYYFNNLPYTTYYSPDKPRRELTRKTTPIYNAGHFHWTNKDDIKIVAYIFSYSWDKDASAFDHAPRMVVNLPAVVYNETDNPETTRTMGTYLENNFYEIQLRLPNHAQDDYIHLDRNKHYIIRATINAPGSKSSFEPIEIDSEIHFTEHAWNDTIEIEIGDDGTNDDIRYLTLNTDRVEMRNIAQDATTLRFASSSPITSIELKKATYIDKWSETITLYDGTKWIDPTNQDEEVLSSELIKATASSGLNGTVTINSPIPTNDTPRYLTFEVTNEQGDKKQFDVVQYPAISITNLRAYFSYRTDFGSYYTNSVSPYRGKAKWDGSGWSYPNQLDAIWESGVMFVSKVSRFVENEQKWKIFPYYWVNLWILGYRIVSPNDWGDFGEYFVSDMNNARIYHVTINATGVGNYIIGRPRLDSDGYTDAGPSNANLVSSSFMIASQLGESSEMSGFTNALEAAKQHCKLYAEVYQDENGQEVHLTGWRLPTAAEIKIIAERQGIANAAVDEVLAGKTYIAASGEVVGKQNGKDGIYIRCIRDHFVPATSAMGE